MSLRLTNTLGGKVEELAPLEPGHVRMYSCGPTVYGPSHVGNFRAFLLGDLVKRYLEWSGYRVTWVMNITDVDDRIIRDLAAAGETLDELTAPHIARFLKDLGDLRIGPPTVLSRATEHIPEMAELVQTLIEKGHAYRADDGSIFFRISTWPAYGTLARLDPQQARVGERVAADDYGKDDARDFALWKGPKAGEPSWDTVVGPGRPGWHVECSAMSMAHLGPSFDIHSGGVDLVFPHHEDEIAQSEAATGQPFVGTWLHCAHLQMAGSKMARSVGNIERVSSLLERGVSARALRYVLIAVHYRAALNYADASLTAAGSAIERLDALFAALAAYREDRPDDPRLADLMAGTRTGFEAALDDDLNIAPALAVLFDFIREVNRRIDARTLSTADAGIVTSFLHDLDRVLGIGPDSVEEGLAPDLELLLEARAAARTARNWAESDRLRDELAQHGIVVEDTRDGQRWRRAD